VTKGGVNYNQCEEMEYEEFETAYEKAVKTQKEINAQIERNQSG
jgi:hypothetical protein